MVRLRRDIHQHPELSFQECAPPGWLPTPWLIGLSDIKTGVVARASPRSGRKRPHHRIRADMDALPIHEQVDVPSNPPRRGDARLRHDSHTAMLLGAHLLAQSYAEEKRRGKATRLLFQPAEEAFDADGISGATP